MLMHFINKSIEQLIANRYNDGYKKKKTQLDQPLKVNGFRISWNGFNSFLMLPDPEVNKGNIRKIMSDIDK